MKDNLLHIALCDDEPSEIEYVSTLVRQWMQQAGVMACLSAFDSAEHFLFHYAEDKSIDILLLDIQMKAMDGVALARQIRADNEAVQIAFITGYPDFMAEGFDVSALHYLMKPVKAAQLFTVLERALQNVRRPAPALFLTVEGEVHRIPLGEIQYVEAQGHYVTLHTVRRTFTVKMNLSDIHKSLGDGFFRCQRSFIVNIKYVRKITRTVIELDNRTEVPLSRELYAAAHQALIRYFPSL